MRVQGGGLEPDVSKAPRVCGAAAALLLCVGGAAHAQSWAEINNNDQIAMGIQRENGLLENGSGNGTVNNAPRIDPCFVKQNALRPCNTPSSKPEVDAKVVGTWKFALPGGGFWVLAVHPDGTYQFHSEAHDGVQSQTGIFSASKGAWSMTAYSGPRDYGTYVLSDKDTWVATGHLGTGTWRRVLAKNTASNKP